MWARYILRLLARAGRTFQFSVSPLYISTYNNIDCAKLARLSDQQVLDLASVRGWTFLSGDHVFSHAFREISTQRVPTLPTDSDVHIAFVKHLADKRIYRPKSDAMIPLSLCVLGKGTGAWAQALKHSHTGNVQHIPWPSGNSTKPRLSKSIVSRRVLSHVYFRSLPRLQIGT